MGRIVAMKVRSKQRKQLEEIVARPSAAAGFVRRARVVLLSAEGISGREISVRLDLSPEQVSRIRARFRADGVDGLHSRPKAGRQNHAVPPATVDRVVQMAMSPPPAGRSRWTTRLLARNVGLTSGCVSDLLRKHGLKPHFGAHVQGQSRSRLRRKSERCGWVVLKST